MKKTRDMVLSLLFVAIAGISGFAQENPRLPLHKEAEASSNIHSDNLNPVSLWYSPAGDFFDGCVDGKFTRGDYHNIDESSKINGLGVSISGQKRFRTVICSGAISYRNGKEFAKRWNSTSLISDDNPFIIADSIKSDFSSDRFLVEGKVAVKPLDWMIVGVGAKYSTVSSANQTDPRPHDMAMRFLITPGLDFLIGKEFSIGIFGSADILSETIEHTIIDPRLNYTYFRFNGIGDYSPITTSTSSSYPRDYNGVEYTGGLHFVWDDHSSLSNNLQILYASNSEKTRDGGSVFTFLGGDYSRSLFRISDRFRVFRKGWSHNIQISAEHKIVKGIWYEQTSFADPDKNNQLTFKVHESSLKNRETATSSSVSYRLDKLSGETPTFTFDVNASVTSSNTIHYELDGFYRKYTVARAVASASKHFIFGKNMITAQLGVNGMAPLSSSQSVKDRLAAEYTHPQFEYMTAASCGGDVSFSYWRAIRKVWLGLFADYDAAFYLGNNVYTDILGRTDRHEMTFGIKLLF